MLFYIKLQEGIELVKSDSKFVWNCQGILIKNVENSGNILIDCNFPKTDLKQLLKDLDDRVDVYIATHTHLDHVNNLHHFEKLKPNAKKYCPIPENEYLLNIDNFIAVNGAIDFGVGEQMKSMIYNFLKFKEVKSVIGFKPGSEFKFGGINLKTIHLPGHSPGLVAIIIENTNRKQRKIFFATDIGLEYFGAWYGFKYNNLKTIRKDIDKIEKTYLNDDFILVSSHGEIYFEKRPEIFQQILKKIDQNEIKVLKMFDPKIPKSLEDIALKGIIYNTKTVNKYLNLGEEFKKLMFFWESGFLLNHIYELVEKGKLREVSNKKWVLNNFN